ncbi:hypothetical protein [Crinalium epipsammum]|uniref:hypothetical protein n=1 Tax=Crinalium epipsammum TaxID=241425 RepID=UPI0012F7B128|nr:hypothetical protein [Crinalium epipsammum]
MSLIVLLFTVNMILAVPKPVSANPLTILGEVERQVQQAVPNVDWRQVQKSVPNVDWRQVQQAVPNVDWRQVQQAVPNVDWQQVQKSVSNVDWQQVQEAVFKQTVFKINFQQLKQSFSGEVQQIVSKIDIQQLQKGLTDNVLSQQVGKIIGNTNKTVVVHAQNYLDTTPAQLCSIYSDHVNGIDNSQWNSLQKGAASTFTILQAVNSASVAGAGALSGYAGIASAISQLGLGGLTTSVAGLLGSSATGAAATAVVTSFVGGPLVMTALLVGGTGAVTWGGYKTMEFTAQKFDGFVKEFCTQPSP